VAPKTAAAFWCAAVLYVRMAVDLKPGSEFYGWFQWACNYSMRDKAGDNKKKVLRDPNHWLWAWQ
jgi:hypothetical protein